MTMITIEQPCPLAILAAKIYRYLLTKVKPFWIQLCYFLFLSCVGFLLLKSLDSRDSSINTKNLDLFFMSASSVTLATMSTIQMEAFTNGQLIVIAILMLLGGEVFVSMLGLLFSKCKLRRSDQKQVKDNATELIKYASQHQIISAHQMIELESNSIVEVDCDEIQVPMYQCVNCLSYVVVFYLIVVHLCGFLVILLYIKIDSTSKKVLKGKSIFPTTFSIFTTISSFANAGFIPTNEGMAAFRRQPGLLMLIIPIVLMGNCLYPACLRLTLWALWRVTRRPEAGVLAKSSVSIDYDHLLPRVDCWWLVATVVALLGVQVALFCSMEWGSAAMEGLNSYEKAAASVFMATNSRHAGEAAIDVGALTSAVLVMFIVMMYLPPYTSFLRVPSEKDSSQKLRFVQKVVLSQLAYLCICVFLICVAEKRRILEDPVNFSVLNIIFEVTSAYGTVGFTTGYSCVKRLNKEEYCRDSSYGFVGRWSNRGKIVIIFVMFLGRLKKFNMHGGKAWKLQ